MEKRKKDRQIEKERNDRDEKDANRGKPGKASFGGLRHHLLLQAALTLRLTNRSQWQSVRCEAWRSCRRGKCSLSAIPGRAVFVI